VLLIERELVTVVANELDAVRVGRVV